MAHKTIVAGDGELSLAQILAVARNMAPVAISSDRRFIERMERSSSALRVAMEKSVPVYGVTTGYGKSCGKRMAMEVAIRNGENLLRFHGCGTGEPIGVEETRAAMLCRILCLARGYSGVSVELLEQMAAFLNSGITPVVPSEGSVGASGDLTPMSYIAACLAGEREVFYRGERMPAARAIRDAGIAPYRFKPKEPLSMMNGTSVMTGIAAIAIDRSRKALDAAVCASAMCVHALKGNAHHYHPVIYEAKPFPGQARVARILAWILATDAPLEDLEACEPETLQDPYSLRCAPQVLGVLDDALSWIARWVEIEANSSNDNPLFDPQSGAPLMGGNFYGGHIALAMDSLKAALASAADLCDRQVALLVDPHLNRGLPADLVRLTGDEALFHHGFKAMSIASSSLAAEALKNTMPAASFSRSTESHNQDKVSMGTIAARDALRNCTLFERVAAIHLLAAAQACEIRQSVEARPRVASIIKTIRSRVEPLAEDRPMDADIETIVRMIGESGLIDLSDAGQ